MSDRWRPQDVGDEPLFPLGHCGGSTTQRRRIHWKTRQRVRTTYPTNPREEERGKWEIQWELGMDFKPERPLGSGMFGSTKTLHRFPSRCPETTGNSPN